MINREGVRALTHVNANGANGVSLPINVLVPFLAGKHLRPVTPYFPIVALVTDVKVLPRSGAGYRRRQVIRHLHRASDFAGRSAGSTVAGLDPSTDPPPV